MEKYCCFLHPKSDYSTKTLDELCPECNLPYGFPLDSKNTPLKIGDFEVVKSLSRGYYGATYVVEKKTAIRKKKLVLKVIPIAIYQFFNKNFLQECQNHAEAAENTQHIVNIEDIFDSNILFGDKTIECHVAILDYAKGVTLEEILNSTEVIPVSQIGQIAIDLLTILLELENKKLFHNDLHPGNIIIQDLESDEKRIDAICDSIKAVAIDFGSLAGKSQSGDKSNRIGDVHWIAQILNKLSSRILEIPEIADERDYRLASLLEERAKILFPAITSQRRFEYNEVIDDIERAFINVDFPWNQRLNLKNFKDMYNAQTLSPWFVPGLLVDDDEKWINEISSKGPIVITGMRGCGKTMLLRALQLHARAIPKDNENESEVVTRLKDEGYLGLYVSCTRLLDKLGTETLHEPFTRLFVAYALEAINAIRHLREIDRQVINNNAFSSIARVVLENVQGVESLENCKTEHDIERYLKLVLNSLSKGENNFVINSNPAIAFPLLAFAIRSCSVVWENQHVFFLLDDVSTRYLLDDNIIELVSTLLFQNLDCSFKFTTEVQTLEMVIRSPGNIEKAREGRDYNIFDLGYHVNEKVHNHTGVKFVEKILYKRSQYHNAHPRELKPSEILGDTTLKSIAESIVIEGKASDKKTIYQGITAISSVCVGDIGDVITLYENILKESNSIFPISAKIQNECYLKLCNSRLFDINRRESKLYDFAESFAEAAHYLLIQSYKRSLDKNNKSRELRQYYSIFINITTGDIDQQKAQVRELIDAGIFNFSGGPQASRTNRLGSNPQQQFKLTYRKLYGVSKHIGLTNGDRFELSGDALEQWLNNPKDGKEILIRNLKSDTGDEVEKKYENIIKNTSNDVELKPKENHQLSIFETQNQLIETNEINDDTVLISLAEEKAPSSFSLNYKDWTNKGGEYSAVVAGLGFEERTLESVKRIVNAGVQKALLVEFEVEGKTTEIMDEFKSLGIESDIITVKKAIENLSTLENNILADITGLPKAVIFNIVRQSLINKSEVNIVSTEAKYHYPLDEDIDTLLNQYSNKDETKLLESLSQLLKGEKGPYKLINLLPINTDSYSTRRVLIAFSSPKHERLYSLLDEREYDKIHLIVPPPDNPRNKLARIAAEIALRKYNHAEIIEFPSDNLHDLMEYLSIQYQHYFVNQNYSFEIALTGSKIQAIASAAITAVFKVNQCWYVQPSEWDENRFTEGTEETIYYNIKV